MNIAVAGLGYVGLANAVLLAQHHKVTGVDIMKDKVELINNGCSPIEDRELERYLKKGGCKPQCHNCYQVNRSCGLYRGDS